MLTPRISKFGNLSKFWKWQILFVHSVNDEFVKLLKYSHSWCTVIHIKKYICCHVDKDYHFKSIRCWIQPKFPLFIFFLLNTVVERCFNKLWDPFRTPFCVCERLKAILRKILTSSFHFKTILSIIRQASLHWLSFLKCHLKEAECWILRLEFVVVNAISDMNWITFAFIAIFSSGFFKICSISSPSRCFTFDISLKCHQKCPLFQHPHVISGFTPSSRT